MEKIKRKSLDKELKFLNKKSLRNNCKKHKKMLLIKVLKKIKFPSENLRSKILMKKL